MTMSFSVYKINNLTQPIHFIQNNKTIGNVYFARAMSKLFQLCTLRTIKYQKKRKNEQNC